MTSHRAFNRRTSASTAAATSAAITTTTATTTTAPRARGASTASTQGGAVAPDASTDPATSSTAATSADATADDHDVTTAPHDNDTASPATPSADLARALAVAATDAAGQDYPAATLYVVATPIGNRADITVRALACLTRMDAIAAEDTRTARSLLHHYGFDKPMVAAHRHNEHEAARTLVARIAAGERVAYLSDAGTPGISDPGARLAAAVRDAGFRVLPLPGASALTTAVSAAGLADGPIHFAGFLPNRTSQATTALAALAATPGHLVFYEAPHRIVDMLGLVAGAFPDRDVVIARELTKRFETLHRCRADAAVAWIEADAQRQRGEFVVIVEAEPADDAGDDRASQRALARALPVLAKLSDALSVSEAASLAAELTGVSRKVLYAEALRLRAARSEAPPD